MIAALFVATGGVYFDLPDVEPWDVTRDAKRYAGSHPVIAHPPCERWGRYWSGGPSAKVRRVLGDDDGAFASALASVERCGGVLEHPEASHAFRVFGLGRPHWHGWHPSPRVGFICQVEQGHYGHSARKKTWLYAVGCELPDLLWGECRGKSRLDEGFHSKSERDAARAAGAKPIRRLSTRENIATPVAFRDMLLTMARSVKR